MKENKFNFEVKIFYKESGRSQGGKPLSVMKTEPQIESIKNFLCTGEFISAPFGTDKDLFIKQFGKSEDYFTVSEKDNRITLLKYGIIEFYFSEPNDYQKLDGILFQPQYSPSNELNFKIDLEWISYDLTFENILKILTREGIEFTEKKDEIGQYIIETSGKIIFYFSEGKGNYKDWGLNKFGRFKY